MDEATEGLLHELAIRRVLEHYMRANDDRRLDDLIELFEPEAVFRMRGDTYRGRDEIRSFFESGPDRSAQPRWHEPDQRLVMPRSVHLLANPVIEVTGAVARAESDFVVIDRSGERARARIVLAGRYRDDLRRGPDGRWRFVERTAVSMARPDAAEGTAEPGG